LFRKLLYSCLTDMIKKFRTLSYCLLNLFTFSTVRRNIPPDRHSCARFRSISSFSRFLSLFFFAYSY